MHPEISAGSSNRVVIVGGGAAGFFAAITCAEASPTTKVILFEKSSHFLSKVRISGGGRCNVTHSCFEPRELSGFYPRGGSALLGAFQRFQPRDTVEWFERRGVKLKTEPDGRMFPVTDSSRTIIDCLMRAATAAGVELVVNRAPDRLVRRDHSGFGVRFADGETLVCDCVLLATGGCRVPTAGRLAVSLGHTLEPPVPSLFTFHVAAPWLQELAGISVPEVEVSGPGLRRRERGPLLITHVGLSGPVILKLSAWCARELHGLNYQFPLRIHWLPHLNAEKLSKQFDHHRTAHAARLIVNSPLLPLPGRLWQGLVMASGLNRETRWAALSRSATHQLVQQLLGMELQVIGKTLNQDEFVTCGGVRLSEVNFRTMESRLCPGLFFAGELLDIDGLTGGFNFQSAWTTGWLAGNAMSEH
jgi:predicted Rossmann fold flavoprotein